ncbi:unnamed protein product [Paramecium sonneborni]|uniref:Polyadenylate-binding protein n=1 Tax=Paramecium sonneborni TaxID=65129 RepID=A0A8S1PFW8_9CILI|nr:unnamed protein product [Paramecium sonneborni]
MSTTSIPAERTLFVSKYPQQTTTEQLKKIFSEFGQIEQIASQGSGVCIIYKENQSVTSALQKAIIVNGEEPYVCQYLNIAQLDHEANVFIDNIDRKETQSSLRQIFSQFGTILSVKLQKSDKVGVAYIQFDKKESADKCIAEQSKLGFKIQKFTSRKQHRDQVYISNIKVLPNITPDQLKSDLQTFVSSFGVVESLVLNRNTTNGTFFAFVKFVNQDSAKAAVKSNKLFNDQQIHIEWVVNNVDKDIEANLFTKNLKVDITEDDLKKAINILVPIEDIKLMPAKQPPYGNKTPTQVAYLYFKTADDGKKLIAYAYDHPQIASLYVNGVISLSPLLPPSEVNSLLQVKKNTFQRQFHQTPYQQYQQQMPTPQYYQQQQQRFPQQQPPRQHHNGNRYPNQKRPYYPQQQQIPDLTQLQIMVDRGQKQQVTDLIGMQLFPKVTQVVGPINAPQVTGILLDFENYQLSDQVKMIHDQAYLGENIRSALEILK